MLGAALQLLFAATIAPLLPAVIARTKAAFAGRAGPPLLQPYFDLAKLFRKGSVVSATTTWVFHAGPTAGVATALAASLLVPFGADSSPVSFAGDLILFAYLFGLSRFFLATSALDTGSSLEGMGATREVSFAVLAEPALFFGLIVIARISGSLSLSTMLAASWSPGWLAAGAPILLTVTGWFIVLLAENSRIPFDDPNTHLELTMIHEVMVLDHSGPAFGMVLYGASIKLLVMGALLVRVLVPFRSGNPYFGWAGFVASMLLLAIGIGLTESVLARLRLVRIPMLLVTACLLSAFGVVLLMR